MSWDVIVQQLPEGVRHVGDIPDDFVPGPVGARADILAGIREVFPDVDFSDPEWGIVENDRVSIEISIKADDPVTSFVLHVRGDGAAVDAVAALLERLQLRAFDPQSSTGIFDGHESGQSLQRWRTYRDQVIENQRRSPNAEQ